ncbi:hypothetical protein GCM10009591_03880 [Brachybacterium tyrofermentans]
MRLQIIPQPFSAQIGTHLSEVLRDDQIQDYYIVAAWAKASGLRRVGRDLLHAIDRGAQVHAAIGVDQGGASIEGLAALNKLTTESFIFFNPGSPKRTFHPKFYFGIGDRKAEVILGSGNLTNGGLYSNYELATRVTVSGDDPEGWRFVDEIFEYYMLVTGDPESCRPLNAELIEEMKNDDRILLGSERRRSPFSGAGRRQGRIFNPSNEPLMIPPKPSIDIDGMIDILDDDASPVGQASQSPAGGRNRSSESSPDVQTVAGSELESGDNRWAKFFKRLSRFDASLNTAPGQIVIPKAFADFFGELEIELDGSEATGSRQRARKFRAILVGDTRTVVAEDARIIEYVPAPTHKRTNTELRFAFRTPEVRGMLAEDDYLTFEWLDDGTLQVALTQSNPSPDDQLRYGWLSSPL